MAGIFGGGGGGGDAFASAASQQAQDQNGYTSGMTALANAQTTDEKLWQQVRNNRFSMQLEQTQFNAKTPDKVHLG